VATLRAEKRGGQHVDRSSALAPCRPEGGFELRHVDDLEGSRCETQLSCGHLRGAQDGRRDFGAMEHRDSRDGGHCLLGADTEEGMLQEAGARLTKEGGSKAAAPRGKVVDLAR
jgi:hypothetical protein